METIAAGIRSKRLMLRPVERRDAPRIVEALADYDIARNLATVPHPYTHASFEDFLMRQAAPGDPSRPFAVVERDVIGIVGLSDIHEGEEAHAAIGYWIAKPYWGRGFATEAAGALVEHAFSSLGFAALKSGHFKDNAASGRVLAKLGFRYAGENRRRSLARGEDDVAHIDVLLTRRDWETRKLTSAGK